jgi:hypothetical protein
MKNVLFAKWLAVFLGIALTGCVTGGKSKAPPAVTHFWFDYNYEPYPGKRVWMKVDKTIWVEFYPNGLQSRYKVKHRDAIEGQAGTVVSKFAGDPSETKTLNEGSFEAFIPDKVHRKMPLYFRHRIGNRWDDWQFLTDIYLIE